MSKANERQVGGTHYKDSTIDPWDYIHQNQFGYLAGNIIKYVSRYKKKNGVQDLEKAKHYLEKLIEVERDSEERQSQNEYATAIGREGA